MNYTGAGGRETGRAPACDHEERDMWATLFSLALAAAVCFGVAAAGLASSKYPGLLPGPRRRRHVCLPSSTAERVKSCEFTFSSRKRGEVCGPSRATSRAASSRKAMVPGPPPARSVRTTLRLTTSLALRSSKQSIPRDFSSGAWSRKPKRPEAKALTETPAQSARAFHADTALPRRRARATSPPSAAGARSWRRQRRARDSRPHAEEPRLEPRYARL